LAQFGTDVNAPDDLVSVDEAAAQSGISRRSIFRLAEQGRVSTYNRLGDRRTFVSLREVLAATGFRESRARYDPNPHERT
jgi:predicted DNA-binding transcriptional regulator AlpA